MNEIDRTLPGLTGQPDGWMPSTDRAPVSVGASLIGDRWSLLIVREMLMGAHGFNAIHRGVPAMSRTLLASRLRYLERIGVLVRIADGERKRRCEYRLTRSGQALRPVLEALGVWALEWRLQPDGEDQLNVAALLWHMYQHLDADALPKPNLTIAFRFPGSKLSSGWIRSGDSGAGASVGEPELDVDLRVIVEPRVLNELWWGERACATAIAAGDIGFEGPAELARAYPTWFGAVPVA